MAFWRDFVLTGCFPLINPRTRLYQNVVYVYKLIRLKMQESVWSGNSRLLWAWPHKKTHYVVHSHVPQVQSYILAFKFAASAWIAKFSYLHLGSLISYDAGNKAEILRCIGIARDCFFLLEKNIWRSHICTDTKVQLYRTYILPLLLYGCETWSITKALEKRLDAFDTWCLRKISRIPYTRHTATRQSGVSPGVDPGTVVVRRHRR